MPLQNRVDPFGDIHARPERGLFTGNRGIIHDPEKKQLLRRRWTTKAWLICVCDFGGRRREVMGRNGPGGGPGWTELFFLDEPTALAAGHRPCFFCRRREAAAFLAGYRSASRRRGARTPDLDAELHRQRLAAGGRPQMLAAGDCAELPDGAMVAHGGKAFALRAGRALPWGFGGYREAVPIEALSGAPLALLTPRSSVSVLAAGYRPQWHASAGP